MEDFVCGSLSERHSSVQGIPAGTGLILAVLLSGCTTSPESSAITGPFTFHADASGYWNGSTLLDVDSSTGTITVSRPCSEDLLTETGRGDSVDILRNHLNNTHFLTLDSRGACPGGGYVSDARTYTLTLMVENTSHTVEFYGGCYDLEPELEELMTEVDALVKVYGGGYCCCCDYGACWKESE